MNQHLHLSHLFSILLLCLAIHFTDAAPGINPLAPAPASTPSASRDPKDICQVTSAGYCTNKIPPAGPELPLNADDLKAMLAWRDANPSMANFNNSPCTWASSDRSQISRSFVLCGEQGSERRVTGLYLDFQYDSNFTDYKGKRFSWSGTSDLAALISLTVQNGDITGNLQPKWADLKNLTSLSIVNTTFDGELPPQWFATGSFPRLSYLALYSNRFSGALPALSDGALPLVSSISLNNNNFYGPLPESWTKLSNLTSLLLQQNQLSGSLPQVWGSETSFGKLNRLNLSSNSLEGALPANWGSSTAFSRAGPLNYLTTAAYRVPVVLWLERNKNLTGPIPEAWSQSGAGAAGISEYSYTYFPFMTVYVQPQTGICGPVPPYVIALVNNAARLGDANPANPEATIAKAYLPACPRGTATSG